MKMFLFGALAAWFVCAFLWCFEKGERLIGLPINLPLKVIDVVFWRPWRMVIRPVKLWQFQEWCRLSERGHQIKLFRNFYLCTDIKAERLGNQLYFVRTKEN